MRTLNPSWPSEWREGKHRLCFRLVEESIWACEWPFWQWQAHQNGRHLRAQARENTRHRASCLRRRPQRCIVGGLPGNLGGACSGRLLWTEAPLWAGGRPCPGHRRKLLQAVCSSGRAGLGQSPGGEQLWGRESPGPRSLCSKSSRPVGSLSLLQPFQPVLALLGLPASLSARSSGPAQGPVPRQRLRWCPLRAGHRGNGDRDTGNSDSLQGGKSKTKVAESARVRAKEDGEGLHPTGSWAPGWPQTCPGGGTGRPSGELCSWVPVDCWRRESKPRISIEDRIGPIGIINTQNMFTVCSGGLFPRERNQNFPQNHQLVCGVPGYPRRKAMILGSRKSDCTQALFFSSWQFRARFWGHGTFLLPLLLFLFHLSQSCLPAVTIHL